MRDSSRTRRNSASHSKLSTRSREVTICDLDKEYIRKFFIDSLISLAQD